MIKNKEIFFMKIWAGIYCFLTGAYYVKLTSILGHGASEKFYDKPFISILLYLISACMLICGASIIFERLYFLANSLFVMASSHGLIAFLALIDYFKEEGLWVVFFMIFFISASFLYMGIVAKMLIKKKDVSESWYIPLVIFFSGILFILLFGKIRFSEFKDTYPLFIEHPYGIMIYIFIIFLLLSAMGVVLFAIQYPSVIGGRDSFDESDEEKIMELFDNMDDDKNNDGGHIRLTK